MIHKVHVLPIAKQCKTLELFKSSGYCKLVPVSDADGALMLLINEIHLEELISWGMWGVWKMRIEAIHKRSRLSTLRFTPEKQA